MKVLCIGHTSWDMTVPVDEYPVENAKYRFNEKYPKWRRSRFECGIFAG